MMNTSPARLLLAAAIWIIAAAASAQPLLRPAWLAANLRSPDLLVLDLRDAAAYDAGHVPGAVAADFVAAGWRIKTPMARWARCRQPNASPPPSAASE